MKTYFYEIIKKIQMYNPLGFYSETENKLQLEQTQLKKQLINNSLVRFVVFLATVLGFYFTFGDFPVVLIVTLVGSIAFAFFCD